VCACVLARVYVFTRVYAFVYAY